MQMLRHFLLYRTVKIPSQTKRPFRLRRSQVKGHRGEGSTRPDSRLLHWFIPLIKCCSKIDKVDVIHEIHFKGANWERAMLTFEVPKRCAGSASRGSSVCISRASYGQRTSMWRVVMEARWDGVRMEGNITVPEPSLSLSLCLVCARLDTCTG